MRQPKTILAVGGHMCDMEYTAGAVLAKHIRLGDKVYLLAQTVGEKGHPSKTPEEYLKEKVECGNRCAEKLGVVESIYYEYPDAELEVNKEVQMRLCDDIRRIRPDIVICHWKKAGHPDHLNSYFNIDKAIFYASLPSIKRENEAWEVKRVFYTDNWEDAEDFVPNVYISFEEQDMVKWQDAIREWPHARGEVCSFHYADYYKHLASCRGAVAGCGYAQAFYTNMERVEEELFI